MKNENVKFNEVRCKKLLLGDEETGFIQLSVTDMDGTPLLKITSPENEGKGEITIHFEEGKPVLSISHEKEDKTKSLFSILYNDKDAPYLSIGTIDSNGDINMSASFGIIDTGFPGLILISTVDDKDSYLAFALSDDNSGLLSMVNEQLEGGRVYLAVHKDKATIMMTTTDRFESFENNEGENPWAIMLNNNSDKSVINVERQHQIRASREDKKTNSEE